jgi:hypothetical protein
MLKPESVDKFRSILEFEADDCIQRIVDASERDGSVNPYKDLQLCSMNFITQMCFATSAEDTSEPLFKQMIHFVDRGLIYAGIAGDLSSFLPSLGLLDVVTRKEKEMQDFISHYRDKLFRELIDKALNGDAECVIKTAYEEKERWNLDDDDILVFMSNRHPLK